MPSDKERNPKSGKVFCVWVCCQSPTSDTLYDTVQSFCVLWAPRCHRWSSQSWKIQKRLMKNINNFICKWERRGFTEASTLLKSVYTMKPGLTLDCISHSLNRCKCMNGLFDRHTDRKAFVDFFLSFIMYLYHTLVDPNLHTHYYT